MNAKNDGSTITEAPIATLAPEQAVSTSLGIMLDEFVDTMNYNLQELGTWRRLLPEGWGRTSGMAVVRMSEDISFLFSLVPGTDEVIFVNVFVENETTEENFTDRATVLRAAIMVVNPERSVLRNALTSVNIANRLLNEPVPFKEKLSGIVYSVESDDEVSLNTRIITLSAEENLPPN
jgi:hypothetical protein